MSTAKFIIILICMITVYVGVIMLLGWVSYK